MIFEMVPPAMVGGAALFAAGTMFGVWLVKSIQQPIAQRLGDSERRMAAAVGVAERAERRRVQPPEAVRT